MAIISPVQATSEVGRRSRRPTHNWYGRTKPYAIQPVLMAPVLPGETLKSASMQARIVTDPVANPLIGWWQEYYFFYVKHRDLDERAEYEQMMLDMEWTKDNVDSPTADGSYNFLANNVPWARQCLKRIVEEYFRNEGEAWDVVTIAGLPASAINNKNVLESAVLADSVPDPTLVNEAGTGTLTATELDSAYRTWEFMRQQELTQMSYEDFLRTYGVRTSRIEQHRPELIRYVRHWQYPSSVINPADGLPSSALSWALQERIDKDRFFQEPGWIVGLSLTRPKVYMTQPAFYQFMDRNLDWMPAVLREDVYSSLKWYDNGTGPASVVTDTDGYWIDVRDVFVHGDQFTFSDGADSALPPGTSNGVNLPTAGLNVEYPAEADINALFSDSANSRFYVRQDGVVTLNILGTQQDHT